MNKITSEPDSRDKFLSFLDAQFTIPMSDIQPVIKEFHSEMKKGLAGYPGSLKMLPSFSRRPTGTEKGRFLTLDLGGTNLRILAVELDGRGKSNVSAVSRFFIRKKFMQGTGKYLFDFIADSISRFFKDNTIDQSKKYNLSFTFSFPVEQTDIASGTLIKWTKGFTAKGVIGEDIVVLLNNALKRKGISCINVAALVNDTVGTLASKCYSNPSCDIGVILGTGTNACYLEKLSNITKIKNANGEMIVNMEWGNFNKFARTSYDENLDKASSNPGAQHMEKMVSGMYLGEITRMIICDLIRKDMLFSMIDHDSIFNKPGSFETRYMSIIASDDSFNLNNIETLLTELGVKSIKIEDKKVLKRLCKLVSHRSATIAAIAISAIIMWMDQELNFNHIIGVDGSLFEKYAGYTDKINNVLFSLFKKKSSHIFLESAKDGSGKGAAVIAATATAQDVVVYNLSKRSTSLHEG